MQSYRFFVFFFVVRFTIKMLREFMLLNTMCFSSQNEYRLVWTVITFLFFIQSEQLHGSTRNWDYKYINDRIYSNHRYILRFLPKWIVFQQWSIWEIYLSFPRLWLNAANQHKILHRRRKYYVDYSVSLRLQLSNIVYRPRGVPNAQSNKGCSDERAAMSHHKIRIKKCIQNQFVYDLSRYFTPTKKSWRDLMSTLALV